MVQLKIAFLDEEEAYLEQLQGYLVRRKELFFKISTFKRAEAFLKIQKETDFDAVVMTTAFWEALEGQTKDARRILLNEGLQEASLKDCLSVQKYQSAEKLLCQISAMLWQEEQEEGAKYLNNMAEMIGIYSPVHHESQMLFGITMAQILGEEKKTLYVNLMEHSGFYRLVHTEDAENIEDIGDLFYGMMQGGRDFAAGLHRVRQSCRNFDYIPPAVNPEHLSEITKPLYEQLLVALKSQSGYEVVIVDFGMVFLGFAEILSAFTSCYCLGQEGALNRYRTEEFLEYLEKEGGHARTNMTHLLLPESMFSTEEGNLLESSLYGSMGDYIRRCLYGGPEIG